MLPSAADMGRGAAARPSERVGTRAARVGGLIAFGCGAMGDAPANRRATGCRVTPSVRQHITNTGDAGSGRRGRRWVPRLFPRVCTVGAGAVVERIGGPVVAGDARCGGCTRRDRPVLGPCEGQRRAIDSLVGEQRSVHGQAQGPVVVGSLPTVSDPDAAYLVAVDQRRCVDRDHEVDARPGRGRGTSPTPPRFVLL